MNKPLFIISSPFDTFSGYGARARDLIKAIIELDRYEVKLIPQRWGETPWGFMDENPDVGGLGVRMVDGKGKFLPESKRGLPTPTVSFYKIFGLARIFPKSKILIWFKTSVIKPELTPESTAGLVGSINNTG